MEDLKTSVDRTPRSDLFRVIKKRAIGIRPAEEARMNWGLMRMLIRVTAKLVDGTAKKLDLGWSKASGYTCFEDWGLGVLSGIRGGLVKTEHSLAVLNENK